MLEKALWASSTYASEAKVEKNDDYEMVKIPIAKSHDKHLAAATAFLSAQGIHKTQGPGNAYKYEFEQVLSDIELIDLMSSSGGDLSPRTEVEHWAYFNSLKGARIYAKALLSQKYEIRDFGPLKGTRKVLVKFAHAGTLQLTDISARTMRLDREARRQNGLYDGWEVTVDARGNLKPAEQ